MQLKRIPPLLIWGLGIWVTGGASSVSSKIKMQAPSKDPIIQISQNYDNHLQIESSVQCSPSPLSLLSISINPSGNLLTAIYFSANSKSGDSSEETLRKKHWNLENGKEVDLPFNLPLEITEPSKGFKTEFTKLYLLNIITFTPDGKTLIGLYHDIVYGDAIVKLWKTITGEEIRDLRFDFDPDDKYSSSLNLASDGRTIIWGGINSIGNVEKIALWDINTGKIIRSYDLKLFEIQSTFDFSPKAEMLVSMNAPGNYPINVFDLSTKKELRFLPGYGDAYNLALDEDGKTVFVGGLDGLITVRDLVTGKQIQTLKGHTARVAFLTLNSQQNILLTGGWDGTIRVWDIAASKAVQTFCVE